MINIILTFNAWNNFVDINVKGNFYIKLQVVIDVVGGFPVFRSVKWSAIFVGVHHLKKFENHFPKERKLDLRNQKTQMREPGREK